MKNFLTGLATFLTICSLSLTLASGMAMAQDEAPSGNQAAPESSATPAPTSLNVGTYLTAPGQNTASTPNFGALIVRVINFLALTIGSFAFVAIVFGGFTMIISGGRETQLQKGKDIIKFAITGLIVAMSAYFITAFMQSVFFEYGG